MVNVEVDSDLVAAVTAGEMSNELALLTQLLRNQEADVKKKETTPAAFKLVAKAG